MRRSTKWGEIPQRVSWLYFKTRLFESLASEGVVERTIYQYELAFRRLEVEIPITYLEEISPERLDYARTQWSKKIKRWAAENHVRFIKAAMRRAEDWKFIKLQNWRIVRPLPRQHRKLYYDPSQLSEVISAAKEPWAIAMRLMGRAGLRAGEVLHLTWEDCDLKAETLHIRKKAGWQPKTKRQICKDRDIPISSDLLEHLKGFHKPYHALQDLILGGQTPIRHNKFWYEIKKCLRAVGLKGYPHAFRHTLASHLSQANENLKQIGEIMGHSDITTTAIYVHSDDETRRKTISKLPSLSTAFVRGSASSQGIRRHTSSQHLPSIKPIIYED